jgi:hypothetical protein
LSAASALTVTGHDSVGRAPSGSTIAGVGSTATRQSWMPVFLSLPAR